MKVNRLLLIILPIVVSISVIIGISIGSQFSSKSIIRNSDRKINTIMNMITDGYVDTVNMNEIVEKTIPQLLSNLDPHTVYIPAKDLSSVNEELDGSFSGIGISFFLLNDTVRIIEVLSGGPSEKVGLMAGDKIVSINDSTFTGPEINNQEVFNKLRGLRGTNVKLGITRNTSEKILYYDITRGEIPLVSIDASYMVDKEIGYIRIDKFARTTYDEFLQALVRLKNDGAEK